MVRFADLITYFVASQALDYQAATLGQVLMSQTAPQFGFKFNFGVLGSVASGVKQLLTTLQSQQFQVSMDISTLSLKIGRMYLDVRNISQDSLDSVRSLSFHLMSRFHCFRKRLLSDSAGPRCCLCYLTAAGTWLTIVLLHTNRLKTLIISFY
jgi:hypothetical protein